MLDFWIVLKKNMPAGKYCSKRNKVADKEFRQWWNSSIQAQAHSLGILLRMAGLNFLPINLWNSPEVLRVFGLTSIYPIPSPNLRQPDPLGAQAKAKSWSFLNFVSHGILCQKFNLWNFFTSAKMKSETEFFLFYDSQRNCKGALQQHITGTKFA